MAESETPRQPAWTFKLNRDVKARLLPATSMRATRGLPALCYAAGRPHVPEQRPYQCDQKSAYHEGSPVYGTSSVSESGYSSVKLPRSFASFTFGVHGASSRFSISASQSMSCNSGRSEVCPRQATSRQQTRSDETIQREHPRMRRASVQHAPRPSPPCSVSSGATDVAATARCTLRLRPGGRADGRAEWAWAACLEPRVRLDVARTVFERTEAQLRVRPKELEDLYTRSIRASRTGPHLRRDLRAYPRIAGGTERVHSRALEGRGDAA